MVLAGTIKLQPLMDYFHAGLSSIITATNMINLNTQ